MKKALDRLADTFGEATIQSIEELGSICLFFWNVIKVAPRLVVTKFHLVLEQLQRVGVESLPLISMISVFVGAVTVWQAKYMFQDYFPYSYIGLVVGKTVLLDLGPVLTSLVITGRVGAMLAAELGTMRVTEQIDAMKVLALDPYLILLSPRVLAGFIMMPILGIYASFIAIVAAQVIATIALNVEPVTFYNSIKMLFSISDVVVNITKTLVFGGVIVLSGCYYGFLTPTKGGAVEVGKSTNKAVVAASVLILVFNLIVMTLLS
ncbi:MAG: ABC transporter permease [Chitinivibrionales bacterium]|nr:ABC transporter permease [Chitinivibrionales bacterium]